MIKPLSPGANCFKHIFISKTKTFYISNDLIAYKNHMLITNISLTIKLSKYNNEDHSY